MLEKFEIKSGIHIRLHYRLGYPSHLTWSSIDRPGSLMHFNEKERDEISLIDRIRNEKEFENFVSILAQMHGLEMEKIKAAGDIPGDAKRCIVYILQ